VKLLVDVGVGRAVEEWLESQGYDVSCVRHLDPRMRDDAILALAADEQRLVITMDADFGELVFRSAAAHCGVLLLRLEDADGETKAAVVEEIFTSHAGELAGQFSVYKSGALRIRTL
jgi:predicted nuclease of predicted toxin-antitoxin system